MDQYFDTSSIPRDEGYWSELEQRVAAAMTRAQPALRWLSRSPGAWLSGGLIVAAAAVVLLMVRVARLEHDPAVPQALVAAIAPADQLGQAIAGGDAPPRVLALAASPGTAEPESR